jgi:uncharacterized membrane protein YhaH (DUF805 family)
MSGGTSQVSQEAQTPTAGGQGRAMRLALLGIVLTVTAFVLPLLAVPVLSAFNVALDAGAGVFFGVVVLALWLIASGAAVWFGVRALRAARASRNPHEFAWSAVSLTLAASNAVWTIILVIAIIGALNHPNY